MKLGRKQALTKDKWDAVMRDIEQTIPTNVLEQRISKAVSEIQAASETHKLGIAWSGGKDSIALEWIMAQAGAFPSVLAVTNLEFTEFTNWVKANAPQNLTIINTGQDLEWLSTRPHMLFPEAEDAGKWFRLVQHKAQAKYFKDNHLDAICLGRRTQDGNYTGGKGKNWYTSKGITRWSPISDWTHEEVIALMKYAHLELPPIYSHPRGFEVGTGAWAARPGTSPNPNHPNYGWAEIHHIQPDLVHQSADWNLPGAKDYLKGI